MSKNTNRIKGAAEGGQFRHAGLSVAPKADPESPAPAHLLDYAGLYAFKYRANLSDDELIASALCTYFGNFAPLTMTKYFTFDFIVAEDEQGERFRFALPSNRSSMSPSKLDLAKLVRGFRKARSLPVEMAGLYRA